MSKPFKISVLLGALLLLGARALAEDSPPPPTIDQVGPRAVSAAVDTIHSENPEGPILVLCGEGTGALALPCEKIRDAVEKNARSNVTVQNLDQPGPEPAPISVTPPSEWKGRLSTIRVVSNGLVVASVVILGSHGGVIPALTIGALAATWSGVLQYFNNGYVDWLNKVGWISIRDADELANKIEQAARRLLPKPLKNEIEEGRIASVVAYKLGRIAELKPIPIFGRFLYIGDASERARAPLWESFLKKAISTSVYGVLLHAGYAANGLAPLWNATIGKNLLRMTADSLVNQTPWTAFNSIVKDRAIKNDPQNEVYYKRSSGVGSVALSTSNVASNASTIAGLGIGDEISHATALTGIVFYLGARHWDRLPEPVRRGLQAVWTTVKATGAFALRPVARTAAGVTDFCRSLPLLRPGSHDAPAP